MWHLLTLPNQLTYLHLFLFFFHQVQLFWGIPNDLVAITMQLDLFHQRIHVKSHSFKPSAVKRNITQTTCNFPFLATTYEKVFQNVKSILIIYFILSSISEYSAKLSKLFFSFTINLPIYPDIFHGWERLIHWCILLINKWLLKCCMYQNHLGSVNSMSKEYAVMVFLFQWMIPFIWNQSLLSQIFKSST